jgi:hypothetical protein
MPEWSWRSPVNPFNPFSSHGTNDSFIPITQRESGPFGRSSRRTRSVSKTPQPKDDYNLHAIDQLFADRGASRSREAQDGATLSQRASGGTHASLAASQALVTSPPVSGAGTNAALASSLGQSLLQSSSIDQTPTAIVLRGFKDSGTFDAVQKYIDIAGPIFEDYAPSQNPYASSSLFTSHIQRSSIRLTPAEKKKVNTFDGGSHWVKVTFESKYAAAIACENSPQLVQGHWIYAQPYTGTLREEDDVAILQEFAGEGPPSMSLLHRSSSRPEGLMSPEPLLPVDVSTPAPLSSSTQNLLTSSAGPSQTSRARSRGQLTAIPDARVLELQTMPGGLFQAQPSWFETHVKNMPFLSWFNWAGFEKGIVRFESGPDAGKVDYNATSWYWRFLLWIRLWSGMDFLIGEEEDKED